ncbi:MAG: VOC family protein [Gammaproteobacteria bacterium]
MSKKVSPIPRGYRTATPCLTVNGIDSAVAFYQAAFGAELLTRHTGADEAVAVHATIKIGNSIIALNQEAPEQGILSPLNSGTTAGQIHLYLDDVDSLWNRAIEAGAVVRNPLCDAYWGDRTGILIDNNGHLWSIASKIENLSQDEISRRAKPVDVCYEEPVVDANLVAAEVAGAEVYEETIAA